ncbi:MAG: TPM domain-containing protein [Desulfovibrionaceae bacterium]
MSNSTQTFLSDADRANVIAAVREVEHTTSGEIVPFVASASGQYPAALFNGTLALGLAISIPATWLSGRQDMWSFLICFGVAYTLFFLLLRAFPGMKRFFMPGAVMDTEVARAAMQAFHSHGLHRTRDLTGVLIYISIFERRVFVLADKGINDKVPPRTWDEIVTMVVGGIREKRQADALCEAIRRCGQLLAEHFPPLADNPDELPNLIVQDDESIKP